MHSLALVLSAVSVLNQAAEVQLCQVLIVMIPCKVLVKLVNSLNRVENTMSMRSSYLSHTTTEKQIAKISAQFATSRTLKVAPNSSPGKYLCRLWPCSCKVQ